MTIIGDTQVKFWVLMLGLIYLFHKINEDLSTLGDRIVEKGGHRKEQNILHGF